MSHALHRLGRFGARRPWLVIAAWLAVAVAVIGVAGPLGKPFEDSLEVPGLDSQRAVDLLSAARSNSAGLTAKVVVTPRERGATFSGSDRARSELAALEASIAALPKVLATGDAAGAAISSDGRVAVIRVQYPVIDRLDKGDLAKLKRVGAEARRDSGLQVELGGDLFFAFEESQTGVGELIGVVAAMVILLLAFGSVIAMGLPIGLAAFGLALGIGAMSLIGHVVAIPTWAPELGTMIGLGVGIDYALFVLTRHREFLARGLTVEESAGRAVATAGQAVVFAGGTVVIAMLGLAVAGIPWVTSGGLAISLLVAIMVVASITLLPAFLGLAGLRISRKSRRGGSARSVGPGWARWAGHVTAHAWPYAVGATALLLSLAAPVLTLQLGFPDEGNLPETRTERRAYDLVAASFGPGSNGPLVIAVDLAGNPAVLGPLVDAIRADEGIAGVSAPTVHADVATLRALPSSSPQDAATRDTIQRLRGEVFPAALEGTGAVAHVGGAPAIWGDLGERVKERLPLFIGAVVILSLLLLTVVFRSVLVPLKAALMNLLSIGAAYGVMVMVFQWGWGMSLLGLEATVPIIPFIPLFMFAIVFGLSMDYEVFLLSRVREEYLVTGSSDASVIRGLAATARVITSAALIMISIFLGFALADDPAIKMFGLGLATAIFVDATIVRMVLVPATMTLLGDANWWLPGRLDRLLPGVGIDGEAALPAPDPAPVPVAA